MHTILTVFLSLVALGWIVLGTRTRRGMLQIPRLRDIAPLARESLPRISILITARDEAEKLPAGLASLLALDYPDYEVIAVDDRSQDATPRILEDFARDHKNLKVVHLRELPPGWLGKPHALERAHQLATGQWLVFTDADVRFAPDLLRRALALAEQKRWDHLTLLALVDLQGFWETVAVSYLGLSFVLGVQPWRVADPQSDSYMGVGAFQLLRCSVYEAIGTHRRLAMEVVDDMKLGKLVKQGGFRSGTAASEALVQLRWQEGFRNVVRGMTKNLFAVFGFRVGLAAGGALLIFAISILPLLALVFATGPARAGAAVCLAAAVTVHAGWMRGARISTLYGLTHPLGAAVFCYMILRSMVVTLWRGGIVWRGTFYPLDELRKGLV